MNLYKNKTILVTGASSGIGEAFAIELNKLGANLVLTARSEDKLNTIAAKMNNAIVISGDLSDEKFPLFLYKSIKEKNIKIDIVINNAGFGFSGLFLDSPVKNYKEMMNLNMYSLVELTHLFMKDMVDEKNGGIINISSLASFQPMPYFSIYAATKAFVTSFTIGLYEEYRDKNIRVLGVCPGYTKTNFNKRAVMKNNNHAAGYIMTAEAVVKQSLKAYAKNKYIIINGFNNKLSKLLLNILPQRISLKITKMILRKGVEKGQW